MADELLELIAGDRCPCGHLTDEHKIARSSGGIPGVIFMTGPCKLCPPESPCNGLIEFESGDYQLAL